MATSPYVEINGLVLVPGGSDPARLHVTHSGCVTPSGGGLKIDEYNYPWRDYATALHGGRQLRKYKVEVASLTRSDIDEFCDYVNNAPVDSEFYPESDDRCGYIQAAHAETIKPNWVVHPTTGLGCWRYIAIAEIIVRGSWMYAPDQGFPLANDVSLWQTKSFTNNGVLPAGLDYLLASGDYQSAQYLTNLAVNTYLSNYTELQGYILLCTKMMRNDRFEMNRWGEVSHQYSTIFPMTYSDLQIDFQGSTYCNYGSGGSIALNALHIGNNGKLIFPLLGPLPITANPYIEVWVTSITGNPYINCGFLADLADLPGWNGVLQLGYNKIYMPCALGKTDIFFGIVCGASDAITISSIKGVVQRYIAPSSIYLIDPGLSFSITVEGGGGLALKQLEFYYRDIFYY